jgi:hypothetical protein
MVDFAELYTISPMNLRYPSEERKGAAKEVLRLSLTALILDILVLLLTS